MLRQLRQRASDAFAMVHEAALSTSGPAGIQVEMLSCEAIGLTLYVLVPRISDLLFNLESNTDVVVTADSWQARGVAGLLPPGRYPEQLTISRMPKAAWCEVVEIRPTRLQFYPINGTIQGETIDIW